MTATDKVRYVSAGGSRVEVPRSLNPWETLHVAKNVDIPKLKSAFLVASRAPERQIRAIVSLAYDMITTTGTPGCCYTADGDVYTVADTSSPNFLVAIGDCTALQTAVERRPELKMERDSRGRTLLYRAARSGFYDVTEMLICAGSPVNIVQDDGSTPLHAAAFYDHVLIAELLLSYGASSDIRNKFGQKGNTAIDEAHSEEIRKVIRNFKTPSWELISKAIEAGLSTHVRDVYVSDERVGIVVPRPRNLVLREVPASELGKWQQAWHGTKLKHTPSILEHGLIAAGDKLPDGTTLLPPENHYNLNKTILGIKNWAHAIFVSPSLTYAAHPCYSERITVPLHGYCPASGSRSGPAEDRFCVLIEVRVDPSGYTPGASTVSKHKPLDGEPNLPEWRIDTAEGEILRVASRKHVVVVALVLLKQTYLDSLPSSGTKYDELVASFGQKFI